MSRSPSLLLQTLVLASLATACSAPAKSGATTAPAGPASVAASAPVGETVSFPSGSLTLQGTLYRPDGAGPFPAVLYNHGAAAGMASVQAAETLGPVFARRHWVFFMPYRRGQGLSADAGPYILDEVEAAERDGGARAGAVRAAQLLENEHLDDQLAALAWLKREPHVSADRVAVMGTSFGGIETVLGAERGSYCAAIDSAGAAMSWAEAPELQTLMKRAVRSARVPIFFFQAENDFDVTPSRVLFAEMRQAGREAQLQIYPPYGSSKRDGHTLGYFGASVWADDVLRFLEQNCKAR